MSDARRLPRFAVVGAIGFAIDAGILTALLANTTLSHYSARLISFAAAVTATWYFNRRWVFNRQQRHAVGFEYTSYFVVQLIGAFINLSIFFAVIAAWPLLLETPVIPLAAGASVALLFNFAASKRFVFGDSPRDGTAAEQPPEDTA